MSALEDSINIFMQESPVSVDTATTVTEVARFMKSEDVGSVLVLDNNKIEGIVTDRDIVTKVIALGKNPELLSVAEIMTIDPELIHQFASCKEALEKMADLSLRRLPVVDDSDQLVGIISISDLSAFIRTNSDFVEDILSIVSNDALVFKN